MGCAICHCCRSLLRSRLAYPGVSTLALLKRIVTCWRLSSVSGCCELGRVNFLFRETNPIGSPTCHSFSLPRRSDALPVAANVGRGSLDLHVERNTGGDVERFSRVKRHPIYIVGTLDGERPGDHDLQLLGAGGERVLSRFHPTGDAVSSEQREKGVSRMIEIAL